jgi:hypothetical protein
MTTKPGPYHGVALLSEGRTTSFGRSPEFATSRKAQALSGMAATAAGN